MTLTRSEDDAFYATERVRSRRVHVWDVEEWGGDLELEEWVEDTWPGPNLKIVYHEFEEQPEPTPSTFKLSMHIQSVEEGIIEAIQRYNFGIIKLVEGFEFANVIKQLQPDCEVIARHIEPINFGAEIHFDDESVYLTPAEFGGTARPIGKAQQYVIRFLRDGPAKLSDIEANADTCTPRSAKDAVYALANRGLIKRTNPGERGRGVNAIYALVEE